MKIGSLLIANRRETAIRIARPQAARGQRRVHLTPRRRLPSHGRRVNSVECGLLGPCASHGATNSPRSDAYEHEAEFHRRVDEPYAKGKAIRVASIMEIDTVIDLADTRRGIRRGLKMRKPRAPETERRYFADTW
jgi:hypothetical protein